jgi:hypothetical protein
VLHTRRGVAVLLLLVSVFAFVSAYLIQDSSGANLELAPLFFGAALLVTSLRLSRPRSGSRR